MSTAHCPLIGSAKPFPFWLIARCWERSFSHWGMSGSDQAATELAWYSAPTTTVCQGKGQRWARGEAPPQSHVQAHVPVGSRWTCGWWRSVLAILVRFISPPNGFVVDALLRDSVTIPSYYNYYAYEKT